MLKKDITINGSRIKYWVYNPGLKPTILVVHGFRGNHKALARFARHFRHWRVILPDLPGYGVSEPLRRKHTLRNFAFFLKAFAERLRLTDFTLWGHSYGGSVCIEYAAMRPRNLKLLVLVSPAVAAGGVLAKLGTWYYRAAPLLPKQWQRAWLASPLVDRLSGELLVKNVSRGRKREMLAAGRRNLQEIRPDVVMESSLSYLGTDLIKMAGRIQVKTLIIAGRLDRVVPLPRIGKLASRIPSSAVVVLPKRGHLAPIEEPVHVATLIEDFLGRN